MGLASLNNLYREIVLEHAQYPQNKGNLPKATHEQTLHNPTCGDTITVQLQIQDNKVIQACFSGQGCSISQASASILTEVVQGHSVDDCRHMVTAFSDLVIGQEIEPADEQLLGDAAILGSVAQFPTRIKCATLAWKALYQAIGATEEGR